MLKIKSYVEDKTQEFHLEAEHNDKENKILRRERICMDNKIYEGLVLFQVGPEQVN